jgi:Kef-type K+ transport system membrane component KefB
MFAQFLLMNKKHLKFYFITMLPLLLGILLLLYNGRSLSVVVPLPTAVTEGPGFGEVFKHPLPILLMQMLVILCTAKLVGFCFTKIGQQSVIGEIAAGIFLGPSLLGWLLPGFFAFIFPAGSLGNLQMLSQIGLILFMFIIGMELNLDLLKKKASEALVVSHMSILFPYLLGVLLAYYLYGPFAPANISFPVYALFIGISMSITAFPVLAKILKERGMTKSAVGSMAIICAAIDDVTAWCLLAVVISVAKAGNMTSAVFTIATTLVYVLFMLFAVRPLLRKASEKFYGDNTAAPVFISAIFILIIVSAFIAELIGVHALFGAFLAGVIMPSDFSLRRFFSERAEDLSTMLLLPLFFAFTGLRTQIGLLNTPYLWLVCLAIIIVAVAGKLFGSALSAKMVGYSWKDSLSIGALMNTRGLMELVVLNIGYDLGILSPEIFTMMVFMALATTCMTAPVLNLIEHYFPKEPKSSFLQGTTGNSI